MTQLWTLETREFGKAAVAGSEVATGAVGQQAEFVVVTGSAEDSELEPVGSAGEGVMTADRSPAGGEGSGGVNFAASVALGPRAPVAGVL